MNRLLKQKAPEGWIPFRYEWHYTFPIQLSKTKFYESKVYYNYLNGNTYITLIGNNLEKKEIIDIFHSVLDFKKFIIVVEPMTSNDGRVLVKFHTILKALPTFEQLETLQHLCINS